MKIDKFLKLGSTMGYWNHGYDFPRRCRQMFGGIDFTGRNMLEIGCGKGLFCLWASMNGANQVVGLEPLDEGCYDSSNIFSNFAKMVESLELSNIQILSQRIQDFQNPNTLFDIVLSVASINHLDEESCIHVKENSMARQKYTEIFRGIAEKMNAGGKLIILDCSNENFFNSIKLINPMAKTIEWFKHQTPDFWADLLTECGFKDPVISWPTGRYFRLMGIYNRNKVVSYFLDSAFRLEMTKI